MRSKRKIPVKVGFVLLRPKIPVEAKKVDQAERRAEKTPKSTLAAGKTACNIWL